MRKFLKWLVILVLVGGSVAVLARNVIARKTVEVGVAKMSGFPLEIGAVNVGLFNGQIDVTQLKLMNPVDFDEKMFVDLPEFHLSYRFGSLLTGKPHISEMTVNLAQVVIVKNAKGESNIQRLKGVTGGGGETKSSSGQKCQLDVVHLHIGTVTMKDFSRGKPTERQIPLNIDVTYRDIHDSADITRLVLLTILSQARLPDLGIQVKELQKGLGNVGNLATEAGQSALDKLKQIVPQK